MSEFDQKLIEDIFELCSSKINSRFSSFAKIDDCIVSEVAPSKLIDDLDHRSEILLYGVNVTIRMQFFYNSESFTKSLAHLYEEVNKRRVIDLFNELANLSGGKVKEVFVEQGVVCALSLPMNITTTKLKVINISEVLPNLKYYEIKKGDEKLFAAKVSFEIHDTSKFANFNKDFNKSDIEEGEVEFF